MAGMRGVWRPFLDIAKILSCIFRRAPQSVAEHTLIVHAARRSGTGGGFDHRWGGSKN